MLNTSMSVTNNITSTILNLAKVNKMNSSNLATNLASFILNTTASTILPASSPPKDSGLPPHVLTMQEWFLIGAFLVIMVSGVAGNFLVIYVFGFKKNKKTTEQLILYLGIIDLMTSLFNPPLNIYWTYYGFSRWDFGPIGCKILPTIGPIMTTASGWVLLVFAAERYFAIVKPFANKFSRGTVRIACIGCVLCSAGMYVHYIVALTHFPQFGVCYVPKVQAPEYGYPNIIFIIIRLQAFLVVFVGTNILIYRALKQNHQGFVQALLVGKLKEQRIQQSRRIMRILNVMGLVFVILVFPRELLYLIYNISELIGGNSIKFGKPIIDLNSWLKVLHTSNSCANIFIYAYMQDSYKKQIQQILEWFGCYKYKFRRSNYSNAATRTSTLDNNNEKHDFNRQTSIYRKPSTMKNGIPTLVFFKRAQQFRADPHNNQVELVAV